ncbi:MAG: InlB B-repeat-containing protein [Clostridia bacterium]|nr:InlB B-repeat-containing protein [Clostridia bacterium]
MRNFKRVLSFLLTLVMLVGMVPSLELGVSAATNDSIPGYEGTYKRLTTFNIDLGGAYYYTDFGDEEHLADKENVGIPEGYSGSISIRMYHGTNNDTYSLYSQYLGVVYIDGVAVSEQAERMDQLLMTIFFSVYKKGYSVEAYNFNAGAANQQAYITPYADTDSIVSTFNREVLFGKSTWNMPIIWRSYSEVADNAITVNLDAGPEGNGKKVQVKLHVAKRNDDVIYQERLYTNEKVIRDILGFAPHSANKDGRIFIGWASDYEGRTSGEVKTHQGKGTMYRFGNGDFTGNDGDTLYAIWGYPIMFDADGGIYENGTKYNPDEYLAYVADYAEYKGENTDPAAMYRYVMPDWNGDDPVKEGCRRYDNGAGRAYGLINSDGKTFFTWEGYGENLTIPPEAGVVYPSGNSNGYGWSHFRCTDADDKNNPYGIRFPEFVAIWEPSITYHANAEEYTGSMPTDWLEWDYENIYNYKDYVIRGCGYSKTGATFEGWNTKPDGTGEGYASGDIINQRTNSDPIVLYAQWSDHSFDATEGDWTVTLDPNGGTGGKKVYKATVGQTYKEIIGTLPTPTKSGYIFDGWWTAESDVFHEQPCVVQNPGQGWFLSVGNNINNKFVAPQNVTFYAKWVQIPTLKTNNSGSYTMTFNPTGPSYSSMSSSDNLGNVTGTVEGPTKYKINKGQTYYSCFNSEYAPVATLQGYTLKGWYYSGYHLRPTYTNESYGLSSNATWTANWIKIQHEHQYDDGKLIVISRTPATCQAAGSQLVGCVCGSTKTVTIKKIAHDYSVPWGIESQATCTENRKDIYKCTMCDLTTIKEAEGTALGGHIWGEWYYANAEDKPTCEGTGTQTRDCIRTDNGGYDMCDAIDTQTVDPTGHNYVGTLVPAYCECEETMVYVCQNDPEHWYEEFAEGTALGHLFGEPYDNGEGYTIIECIRESDGVNPECPHEVKTANRYTIVYDRVLPTASFGANTPMYHTYDEVTTLVNPTAANATFAGWYLTPDYSGEPVTTIGAQEILAPRKYYAKWTLTLKLDGKADAAHLYTGDSYKAENSLGAGVDYTITYVYGESVEIPYKWWHNTVMFTGWTNSAIETLGQLGTVPAYSFTANATLTASYVTNSYPVIYIDGVTGEIYDENSTNIENPDKLTKSLGYVNSTNDHNPVEPVRTGYIATLHKLPDMSDSAVGAFDQKTITHTNYPEEKIVYYVKWTANSKTLTLGANSGNFVTDAAAGTKNQTSRTVTHTYDKDTILNKEASPTLNADFVDMYRQGYEFVGWNSGTAYNAGTRYSEDMHKIPANSLPMAAATTLYAEWKPNTFIVEYELWDMTTGEKIKITDDNAETLGVSNWDKMTIKSYTYGANSAAFTTLVRPGYTVTGWKYADGATLNGTNKNVIGSTAVYYDSDYHAHNAKVELREDGNYYIVVHAEVTRNAAYKVTLAPNSGTFVTVNADGSETTDTLATRYFMHTSDVATEFNAETLSQDFTYIYRTGYEFVGWNTGKTYNAGTRYSDEMKRMPAFSVPAATTLYAEWKPIEYNIEYYLDGVLLTEEYAQELGGYGETLGGIDYSVFTDAKKVYTFGTDSYALPVLKSTGKTVSQWYFKDDTARATKVTTLDKDNNMTAANTLIHAEKREDGKWYLPLYATSSINSFDITLNFSSGTPDYAEGHTTTTTIKGHVAGEALDFTKVLDGLTRHGWDFVYWRDETTLKEYHTFESIPADELFAATTIKAYWAPITFDIEYYANGTLIDSEETARSLGINNYASFAAVKTFTYNAASIRIYPATAPNYTFSSANTRWLYKNEANTYVSDGKHYIRDDEIDTVTEFNDKVDIVDGRRVIRLHINLTPKSFTVRVRPYYGVYHVDGGTNYTTANDTTYLNFTFTGGEDLDLGSRIADLHRPGYTFKEWNSAAAGTGTSYSKEMYTIPGSAIIPNNDPTYIYAVWEANTFPIEYYLDGIKLDSEKAAELNVAGFDALPTAHKYATATTCATLTRTGYTISAWADEAGTALASKQIAATAYSYDVNGKDYVIKVYATSTPMQMTVSYVDSTTGSATSAANMKTWFGETVYAGMTPIDYPGTVTFPTEANRDGYHLVGFYNDKNYTEKIESFSSVGFLTTAAATKTVYVKWEADETTPPTGTIDLGVGSAGISTEFITKDKIVYGIYDKSFDNIVITGDKGNNYIAPTVEYFLSAKALTQAEVEALTEWTAAPNGEAFSLAGTADGEYIMYVKLTDDQGNVSYISSQRFIYDTTAPKFNVLENGEYCFNTEFGKEFTVEERYLDKFTVNGEAIKLGTDRAYTLEGSENGTEYVVYAKDKAGNETTVTVNIYNSHDWLVTTYSWSADGKSCTASRVCNRATCGIEETADAEVTGEITVPATCVSKGTTTYTATFAVDWAITKTTDIVDVEIDANNHDGKLVQVDAKAPTCTEPGYNAYEYCPECGYTTFEETVALGHTEAEAVVENNKEATCEENGSYDLVVYCSVCKVELSRKTEKVPALGHTKGEYVVLDHKDATCTENGSHTEAMYCTVCNAELDRKVTFLPKLGHSYETVVTEPTCTGDGYTTYTCTVCGDTYIADVVDALGHSYETVVTEPTCTEGGYTTYTCTVCGHSYDADKVNALGHTPAKAVEENRVDAECGITGSYDMVVYCTECDKELSRESFGIEALTHEYTFKVIENNGYVQCIYCNTGYDGFFTDKETGNIYYAMADSNGLTKQGLFVVEDNYYYGLAGEDYGKLVIDSVYMITLAEKQIFNAENEAYALNGRNSVYAFDEEGKIIANGFATGMHVRDTKEEEPVERTFCYNNYQLYFGLQMFTVEGKVEFRYFNENHGHMYQNLSIWIAATNSSTKPGASGYNPYGLPKGYYQINAEGVLQMPEGYIIVNHGGKYHLTLDGVIQSQGLYEVGEGKLVYVKQGLTLANNEFIWLTADLKNGIISDPDGFYTFGDDFYMELGCFYDVYGRTYYVDEEGTLATGFTKVGEDYYYFNKKSGFMYKDSTLWVGENEYGFAMGNYYFMENGKMYIADTSGYKKIVEEDGKLYFTIDGVKQFYGLYELDGEYYYAQSNGVLVTNSTVWISNVNDLPVTKGNYKFDSEGKLVKTGFITTDKGYTYYYDNLVLAKGLTKIGNDYYFFNITSGMMYSSSTMWIDDNEYGFAKGFYYFGEDGKLFIANEETGVKKIIYENGAYYFTIDGVKQYAGVYELDGDYYYAQTNGKLYVNTSAWLNDTVASKFGGTRGYYGFDSEGKLIKTGFISASNGYSYYYDNLVLAKGFTKLGEDYYFFNLSSGAMYVETTLWVGGDNIYGVSSGFYYFGADGKCTGKVG